MRRAEPIDLSTLDLAALALPTNGESVFRDAVAPALALRLRASGARTWMLCDRRIVIFNFLAVTGVALAEADFRMAACAPRPSPD